MSKYSQSTVQLINTLVKPEMPTYDYDEETVTIDGVKAKKQILTVHKDSKTQIVEYTCYGEGDIYLPRLLALYQAETFSRFEDMAESDAIRFNLFIQDMAQLEDKYDKNVANIIMGNCTVWVYLAAAGKETNELISSKLGKYTTLKYSSSGNKARYSNPSSGFSSQLEGRELLTADELARFARPYQLVMVLGEYPAVMVSYDLHKWQFNRFMGLGNESHNKKYIQIVTDSRPDKRNTNAKIPLWEIWKEQTTQETEYNYLLRRKEVKENNEKSETYDITKNAFYITEDEVINKGQDLFRRKEQ